MAQHRRRSIPKDTPIDTATKQTGIRLPLRLNQRLVAIAKAEGNNVSCVVRRLLMEKLGDSNEAA